MQLIDKILLDSITEEAQTNVRLRKNFNFHKNLNSASQRLLNAVEPGTVFPVHRHQHTDETCILLRGRIRALFYNTSGVLTDEVELDPLSGEYGVNIPAGQWHTFEVLKSGSIIFESKDGPYSPITEENILTLV